MNFDLQNKPGLAKHALMFALIGIISLASGGNSAGASSEDASPNDSRHSTELSEIQWLVGNWQGNAFGGICEEVWSPMSGETMVGTFKLLNDGKVSFYEIMTISFDSIGMVMKVKHFNSDLTGWEEKNEYAEFRFIRAFENEIQFEGLTYRKTAPDSLQIMVTIGGKDNSTRVEEINCRRVEN